MELNYFEQNTFTKLFNNDGLSLESKQEVASSMLRVNILSGIQNAGSGHLGSSFSALEIMLSALMYLDQHKNGNSHFFSSKGHDVPCLYACYEALGNLENLSLMSLRKLNGLPGHPDIGTENIKFNTGSLGMGISKANGWLSAEEYFKRDSRIVLIIGDGEFQEGQNFEALMYLQNNKH